MVDIVGKTSTFQSEGVWDSTIEPGVSVAAVVDEVPPLTVAALVGVTATLLVVIVAVFVLGLFIDCRQQKLLEKKMAEVKRMKALRNLKKVPEDEECIADSMEESGVSIPPAAALRNIP